MVGWLCAGRVQAQLLKVRLDLHSLLRPLIWQQSRYPRLNTPGVPASNTDPVEPQPLLLTRLLLDLRGRHFSVDRNHYEFSRISLAVSISKQSILSQ